MSLNLQLKQKQNQKNVCKTKIIIIKTIFKKQSLNLQLNKVFGDMLTFYIFIFLVQVMMQECSPFPHGKVVRYEDVCTCAYTRRERECECVTHTHTCMVSLSVKHSNSGKVCFLNVVILNRRKQWQEA